VEGKPLSHAVKKYRDEIWDSCKALWSVWVPAQLVNFAFVPRHLRIPYGGVTLPGGQTDMQTDGMSRWSAVDGQTFRQRDRWDEEVEPG
jgi:Mpv17 / PMP22 family